MVKKIVVVTRQTRLKELIARFNTHGQAKFYIEHSGGNFDEYEQEDKIYSKAIESIQNQLHSIDVPLQVVERQFLPNFIFTKDDLIIVVGQDGLVANTAKYLNEQPILGINPDPSRIDGILVPNQVSGTRARVEELMLQKAAIKQVSMARAVLNDGQKLLAFNDLFIGARSHVSARYRLEFDGSSEQQSSSGVLVSTGAGSTGWLSSVFNMVSSVNQFLGVQTVERKQIGWDASSLMFVVREPFISRHSNANLVTGMLSTTKELVIESNMPTGGVIFSDGIETDFLEFNAGSIAKIGLAPQKANLVTAPAKN